MKLVSQILIIILLVSIGFLSRVGWFIPNWALVGALALWAPYLLGSLPLSAIVVLFTLVLSDLVLGFYPEQMWVYLAYVPYLLIGGKFKGFNVLKPLFGSLGFFFISNFGVWISTDFYADNLGGLIDCFMMALPFYRNTLLSDLCYFYLIGMIIYFLRQTEFWSHAITTNPKR